jgi:ABC-type nitrate/sulfonate/bicarbonate transport system substrate-binding protein
MRTLITIAVVALYTATACFAAAAETIKVVVPHRGAWDSSFTELGVQQGFFKKQQLDVQITYVANEAQLQKALITGRADIAVAAGFTDILGAWAHRAPIKIISPEATGAPDVFWFARMGGPITNIGSLRDQTAGFAEPGSPSYFILLTLLKEAGVKDARLLPIGTPDNGYLMVLNAQLDASWGSPPALMQYLLAGEIQVIARGNDSRSSSQRGFRLSQSLQNVSRLGFLRTAGDSGLCRAFRPERRDRKIYCQRVRIEVRRAARRDQGRRSRACGGTSGKAHTARLDSRGHRRNL